jgi:hypothetical protein
MKKRNEVEPLEMMTAPKHTFTGRIAITLEPLGEHENYNQDYEKAIQEVVRTLQIPSVSRTSGGMFKVETSVKIEKGLESENLT